MAEKDKIRFRDLSWVLKLAVISCLLDLVYIVSSFGTGFLGGILA